MTRHLLDDQSGTLTELTPDEANGRWERMRIMPCPDCMEKMDEDVIVYHECN